jgi:chromatin segregation and condensation protein Rec8/ScpA/Scc1 (kleisin family)
MEGELERERHKRYRVQEEVESTHNQRLEALQKAEVAEQEATRKATLQLRERMDHYLEELHETGRLDIRRAK